MDILIEEYLAIKNKIAELEGENKREQYTTRYFANLARIEELEVAAHWVRQSLAWGDERSYLV